MRRPNARVISSTVLSVAAWAIGQSVPQDQGQALAGYRIANPDQSAKYNRAKTITPDKNENRVQIGIGAYTSPKAGDWFDGKPCFPYPMVVCARALD